MAKTETFIAPGSRVVIRSTKSGVAAQWYTTKKEVLVDVQKLVEDVCPMTGEPVARWTEGGFFMFFPARILRSNLILDEGDVNPVRRYSNITVN